MTLELRSSIGTLQTNWANFIALQSKLMESVVDEMIRREERITIRENELEKSKKELQEIIEEFKLRLEDNPLNDIPLEDCAVRKLKRTSEDTSDDTKSPRRTVIRTCELETSIDLSHPDTQETIQSPAQTERRTRMKKAEKQQMSEDQLIALRRERYRKNTNIFMQRKHDERVELERKNAELARLNQDLEKQIDNKDFSLNVDDIKQEDSYELKRLQNELIDAQNAFEKISYDLELKGQNRNTYGSRKCRAKNRVRLAELELEYHKIKLKNQKLGALRNFQIRKVEDLFSFS